MLISGTERGRLMVNSWIERHWLIHYKFGDGERLADKSARGSDVDCSHAVIMASGAVLTSFLRVS